MNDTYRLPTRSLVKNDAQSMIERPDIQRSRFLGSWTRNTTFDAGWLVPFMVDEVLPGDMLKYNVTAYVRMATPLFPMFDNQSVNTFFFFVPARLVWENWNKFMGEQAKPTDSINYTIPQLSSAPEVWEVGGLADHFGIPTAPQHEGLSVNALPFRAYAMIWNEWFRDQNLQDSIEFTTGDGPDTDIPGLMRRNKLHDYFTSALPWPQKFTAPNVPLNGNAYVSGIGFAGGQSYSTNSPTVYQSTGAVGSYGAATPFTAVPDYGTMYVRARTEAGGVRFPDIFADMSGAGVALNALRQSWMVQQLLERDARGGTRYTEIIRSHFGVMSPDARLQRPEYLGGGTSQLQLTPVAQTAPTAGVPVGALGAAGTAIGQHSASYASTEHGYIIGLINVQSELSYSQGLHKLWSRRTRYDFYWPSLAHLGEQAVYRKELYVTGIPLNDDIVFGYQERWQEYRAHTSEVTGLFRPYVTGTLDAWHLSQRFLSAPTLGNTFIQDNPPMARILAAGELAENQQYLANILIRREATRPLPMFGTPAQLGRF